MKNKTINKIIIYTLIVFGISSFSCFPKSYSKYIKEETPVRYYVGIDKLYIGEIENLALSQSSTYEYAHYVFMFNRSSGMKVNDTHQEITLKIIEETCEFTYITSNGNVEKNNNIAKIEYSSKGEDSIKVGYKCPVNDIKKTENELEYISSNIKIYDKFMPEDESYLYLSGKSVKTLLSDYKFNYPEPSTELTFDDRHLVIPTSFEGKYEAFKDWLITEYSASYNNQYDAEILKYVKKEYNNDSDITNLNKELKGLSVRFDDASQSYIYQIDDNFLGHARTYYAYVGPGEFLKAIFINENLTDSETNEMFKSYLQEYSNYNENQINTIMNYVSHYGSLNYIIKPNDNGTRNTIPGFIYYPETNEIQIENTLYDIARSYQDKKIYVKYGLLTKMRMYYNKVLPIAFSDLSIEMLNTIKSNNNILSTVLINNTSTGTTEEFNKYFIVKTETVVDNKIITEHVLINIYSILAENMNCVEIIDLGNNASNITVTENNSKLDVSITLDNQDTDVAKINLTDIVSSIDNYFGTSYNNDIIDSLFTSSSTNESMTSVIDENENSITITYSITLE